MKPLMTEADFLRITEIESYLANELVVFGKTYTDRKVWEDLSPNVSSLIVGKATEMLTEPDIIISEELYSRYTTIGDRQLCDNIFATSANRVCYFALAECIENKGRFISAYEKAITARCNFNTWVLTAHDTTMDNFYKRDVTIDLGSASFSWDILTADYIMADKVDANIRELIYENVMWRTIEPFEKMLQGEKEAAWWFFTTNNWASVCLSAVIGSALAMNIEKSKKALFVAAWEKYIENPKMGFTEDGYCSEGLSYWSYGFSHYLDGTEIIRMATNGKLDSFSDEKMRRVGLFPQRMELGKDCYPSIADCKIGYTPEARPISYINRRLGLPIPKQEEDVTTLYADLLYWMNGKELTSMYSVPIADEFPWLRSWFPNAGVLICRSHNQTTEITVSLKGGNNQEHHNHNDVGSFVVAKNGVQLISDIGHEYYNNQTFSKNRYQSPFYSSYGHSVPLVAGKKEKPEGWENEEDNPYRGEILTTDFSESTDSYKLNLAPVYALENVSTLERSFTYSRNSPATLEILDTVVFGEEETFEGALMTYGVVEETNQGICISLGGEKALISFESNHEINISTELLEGNIAYASSFFEGKKPTRIAYKVGSKIKNGYVKVVIN